MSLNNALLVCLEEQLSTAENKAVNILHSAPVSGGSINEAYCLLTSAGKYMLKLNDRWTFPSLFESEAKGLSTIADTHTIATPRVISWGDCDKYSFLIISWIESATSTSKSAAELGQQLAEMHRHSAKQFGFTHDNYMGSLPQSNKQHSTWSQFFAEERLQPMVKIAEGKKLLSTADISIFERLYARLPQLFDEEAPALLHGDLWSGNYLIDTDGKPYLIDPAVSYGHREFDIAMTTLFGGFKREFYEAYQSSFPMSQGWQQRLDLWNLYPLLLHLNLFGTSYLGQIKAALAKYR